MIALTRLNGSEIYLNADLIATVESHHDTVITLVDGKTYVVREPADRVVELVVVYRAQILALAGDWPDQDRPQDERPALYVLRPVETAE